MKPFRDLHQKLVQLGEKKETDPIITKEMIDKALNAPKQQRTIALKIRNGVMGNIEPFWLNRITQFFKFISGLSWLDNLMGDFIHYIHEKDIILIINDHDEPQVLAQKINMDYLEGFEYINGYYSIYISYWNLQKPHSLNQILINSCNPKNISNQFHGFILGPGHFHASGKYKIFNI